MPGDEQQGLATSCRKRWVGVVHDSLERLLLFGRFVGYRRQISQGFLNGSVLLLLKIGPLQFRLSRRHELDRIDGGRISGKNWARCSFDMQQWQFVGNEFARGHKDEIGEVEEPEVVTEDALEMLAGRGSAVGARRYAVWSNLVEHLTQDDIDTFRPLSQSLHRSLALNSRKRNQQPNSQKRKGTEMEAALAKKTKSCWTGGRPQSNRGVAHDRLKISVGGLSIPTSLAILWDGLAALIKVPLFPFLGTTKTQVRQDLGLVSVEVETLLGPRTPSISALRSLRS
ncbi:hypothetical protein E4U56_005904 [Claviceps arundinis]|uniref:Uncharacterized protein n=1 Tax=Claviceps arundinis TaxID=1623583 RepID=A0A9P7ST00_9HYPO|nr:hypothetical protein E4U56_005904 [Claviceps arundinis]